MSPADLLRIEPFNERVHHRCAASGATLVKTGEHVSRKLDVQPIDFSVRRGVIRSTP